MSDSFESTGWTTDKNAIIGRAGIVRIQGFGGALTPAGNPKAHQPSPLRSSVNTIDDPLDVPLHDDESIYTIDECLDYLETLCTEYGSILELLPSALSELQTADRKAAQAATAALNLGSVSKASQALSNPNLGVNLNPVLAAETFRKMNPTGT